MIKRAYGLSSERGVRVNFPSSKLLPLLGFTVVGDFGAVRLGSPGNRADVGRSEGWVRIPRSVKILLFVERSKLILRIEPLVYLFDARKSARAQRSKTDSKQGGIDEKANVVGRSREGRDSRSYRLTIIIEESWLPKWEGRAVVQGCSEQIRPAEIRVALSWKELRACCAPVHRSNQKTFVIEMESSPFPAGTARIQSLRVLSRTLLNLD